MVATGMPYARRAPSARCARPRRFSSELLALDARATGSMPSRSSAAVGRGPSEARDRSCARVHGVQVCLATKPRGARHDFARGRSRARSRVGGRDPRGSGRDPLWARVSRSPSMKYLWVVRPLAVICSIAPLAACFGNTAGNVGSTKLGDVTNPATHGSPIDELRDACGGSAAMTLAGGALIRRNPYLQQVTKSSVTVGWVSMAADGERVEVTLPDARPLANAPGVREAVVVRNAGENQMWSTV